MRILRSEDPRRASVYCQPVVCLVTCSHDVVDPWLHFVLWFVVWHVVEGGGAVDVVAAFLFLVVVLGVGLSRVILRLAGGVVEFAVGVCGCDTFPNSSSSSV